MAEIHAGLRFASLRPNFDCSNLRFMGPIEVGIFLGGCLSQCWTARNRTRDALV
jgi:hypothetical protein